MVSLGEKTSGDCSLSSRNHRTLVRASSNKPELVVVVESPSSEDMMKAMFKNIDMHLSEYPEVGEYNQKI